MRVRCKSDDRLTSFELYNLMVCNGSPTIEFSNGTTGIVQSIERESGSGDSFNIEVLTPTGNRVSKFVRLTHFA